MKITFYLFLISSLLILLCGCPAPVSENKALKDFQKQQFDFQKKMKINFQGISFLYPDFFQKGNKDHLLKANGISLVSYDLGIYLSVEKLKQSDLLKYVKDYDHKNNYLRVAHDYYMENRRNSLLFYENSVNSALPKDCRYDGMMEVLYGRNEDIDDDLKYFIATMEKEGAFYVFQLICTHEMSGYLWDDFEDILKSVR